MTARLLLRGCAVYWGVVGAMALLAPRSAVSGLKPEPTAFDVFTSRTIGATLITLSIANASATPGRGILLANLVMNTVLGGVDAAAIADDTIDGGAWQGVAVHGGLVAAFGWALHAQRRTSIPQGCPDYGATTDQTTSTVNSPVDGSGSP
jgi:hypothetical protein